MSTVRDTLVERGKSYGKYSDGLKMRSNIMRLLESHAINNGSMIPSELEVALHDIIMKLVRMAADPSHKDNYTDLAGYAELLREVMNEGK